MLDVNLDHYLCLLNAILLFFHTFNFNDTKQLPFQMLIIESLVSSELRLMARLLRSRGESTLVSWL